MENQKEINENKFGYTDYIASLEYPYTRGMAVDRDGTETPLSRNAIPEGEWGIIRVDGHDFRRYTRRFRKVSPFHPVIAGAMKAAAVDLLKHFNGVLSYTQSDEITVVIDPKHMQYGGRVLKLASLAAALATGSFRRYVENAPSQLIPVGEPEECSAIFDGRAYGTTRELAADTVWLRQRSGIKNSITCFAATEFSHAQLNSKKSDERIRMMRRKGKDWNDLPYGSKYGHFFVFDTETSVVDIADRRAAGANEHELENLERNGGVQVRNIVKEVEFPVLGSVANRADVLFDKAEPIIKPHSQED